MNKLNNDSIIKRLNLIYNSFLNLKTNIVPETKYLNRSSSLVDINSLIYLRKYNLILLYEVWWYIKLYINKIYA